MRLYAARALPVASASQHMLRPKSTSGQTLLKNYSDISLREHRLRTSDAANMHHGVGAQTEKVKTP